jgi:Ras GTPase-activating-like protein IQGAP2/3
LTINADSLDPNAHINSLFMETKRCVLYIIRIQTGKSLMDIMIRPVTVEDEQKWAQLAHDELKQQNTNPEKRANPYSDSSSLLDIASMGYSELKRTALANIISLERHGRITRQNHYQDLLNAIALDIRTKHRRRQERSLEIKNALATMAALGQKQEWLQGQLNNYNDYIEQAMATLQKKSKLKKRTLLPFSPQWHHQRELARSGRMPAFGSYRYSARVLHEKGVLFDWRGFPRSIWDKINVTISSDEAGMFHLEGSDGSLMIPGASASVPLDELLEMQFNNVQFVGLFGGANADGTVGMDQSGDGPMKLNVNLLVHLLMKKFYSQA